MPLRDIFVTVAVFGSLPFILTRPHLGILMWCWLGFMNPHRLAWGFSRSFPSAMIIGGATLLSFLLSKEPKRWPRTAESSALLVFLLWTVVTTLFSERPSLAMEQMEKVLKIQLMIFLTMMLMGSKERLNLLVWTITLSLGFYGVKGGIFTILTGGAYKVWGPEGTFIGGNNEIGLALIMTIPLMRYLQLTTERPWIRHGMTAAIVLTGIAVLGTHSRGAFVGIAGMVLFLWFKSRKKIALALLLALAIPFALSLMPEEWTQRMESIQNYQEDGSARGRLDSWAWAYRKAEGSPITGGGFETFAGRLDAHSIYFEILGEHGFVGLGLFLMLMFVTWRGGTWLIRVGKAVPELHWLADLAAMTQVSILGYAFSGAFLGLAYFDLYYNLIAIIAIGKIIAWQHFAESSAREKQALELESAAGARTWSGGLVSASGGPR